MLRFQIIAGLLGFTGVALGAFGAHGLKNRLEGLGNFDNWETATLYLFIHSLAILSVTLVKESDVNRRLRMACWFWTFGVVLFSGSLYILSLTGFSKLGAVTPFGGLSFLVGWGLVFANGIAAQNGKA